jgi:hypothetical protein
MRFNSSILSLLFLFSHIFSANYVCHFLVRYFLYRFNTFAIARITSSQWRSSSSWFYRKNCTHSHTPSDESTKGVISASTNNVAFPMTSIPSKMRYFVMSPPLNFVMLFWANLIYGNVMLYMSLGLIVLLLLWIGNCT